MEGLRRTANAGHDERDVSLGTHKQRVDAQAAAQPKYHNVAGVGLVGTKTNEAPSVAVAAPKKSTFHTAGGALYKENPDGSMKLMVPARDRAPQRPGAPQIFYGEGGKPTAIQFMPDGTAHEIPLPAGLSGKIQPKTPPKVKTPAEIEAESAARARGTAAGKADAAGGGGILSALGGVFGGAKPVPAGAAPKVGDTKTFPNGKVGVFDGSGWVQQ